MIIEEIELFNFCSFKEQKFIYREGLWLVTGINEDDTVSSNGSGKSILFVDALSWVFFDITTRGIKYNDVIKLNCKITSVKVKLNDNGNIYEIFRERKINKGSTLTINGELKDQDHLEQLLGLDYNTFTSAIIHPQDFIGFADKKDRERKEVLTKILNLERFNEYKEKAKELLSSNKDEIKYLSNEINTLNESIDSIKEEIVDLKESEEEEKESNKKEIKIIEERLSKYQDELIKINDDLNAIEVLNKDIEEVQNLIESNELKYGKFIKGLKENKKQIQDSIELTTNKKSEADKKINLISADIRVISTNISDNTLEYSRLKNSKGGKCPTCYQTIKGKEVDSCLKELSDKIAKLDYKEKNLLNNKLEFEDKFNIIDKGLTKILDESQIIINEIDKKEEELKNIIDNFNVLINNHRINIASYDIENRYESLEENKTIWDEELKKLSNKKNPYTELIKNKIKLEKEKEKEIIDNREKLSELNDLNNYYDFWVKAYGDGGIKSYIFDNIIPEFTLRANHYVQELSDGKITIEFDTQTEKKSGGLSEKFSITITDDEGSRPYESWSGGEKKRISIGIGLALSDLISSRTLKKWELSIFDEMLDGLDSDGKTRIISLLEDIQKEKPCMYIISHDIELKDIFENRIVIEKKSGTSSIKEIL